ncbi:MAG TPA: response regulator transcription factor [Rhodothermales bacterium]|nr:response regulator transcription factor [Rhodothermales bacterium]
MTTLWLIEDDAFFRQMLVDLIEGTEDLHLGYAFDACEPALATLQAGDVPDVILSDISLPGMNGTEGTRRIKALCPTAQIIMLTIHDDEDTIFDALCAGASGYLLKHAPAPRILDAIDEVMRGGVPFTAPVARKVLDLFKDAATPKNDYGLTDREKEILLLLADGHKQKQIAEMLFLSPYTVETHLRNVYAKLHVRSGIAAVSKALRERLI